MSAAVGIIYVLIAFLSVVALRNAHGTALFRFPFLFSAIWVTFVLLGFLEFFTPENSLFLAYEDTGVIDVALFVVCTSIFGGFLGYLLAGGHTPRPQEPQTSKPVAPWIMRRMHIASCVIAVMSYLAFLALARLGGGLTAYIFHSGAYTITWEGLPVYLVFVVRFGYVAIVIQLWLWSRTKKASHMVLALLFSLIPFINIIFIFRRSEVVTVGVYFGYFIVNYTRFHMGRIHAISGLVGMFLVFKVFPLLRDEEGKNLSLNELLDQALAPRIDFDSSEIGAGLFRIYYSMSESAFEYGAIIWNAFIRQFVPGSLVGAELKASLLLPELTYANLSFVDFRFYVSPMGFAQAYQQFWIFAAVMFVFIGFFVARLEQRRFIGPRQEIFMVLMIPILLTAVSADISLIVPRFITFAALIAICIPKESNQTFAPNRSHAKPSLSPQRN